MSLVELVEIDFRDKTMCATQYLCARVAGEVGVSIASIAHFMGKDVSRSQLSDPIGAMQLCGRINPPARGGKLATICVR